MKNRNFDSISYDYYSNTTSYVKIILEMLPDKKVSQMKKQIVKELYNFFLNHFSDDKIREISKVSSMFRDKISVSNPQETAILVNYIYDNFLDKIIFDSINRSRFFDVMNESLKIYTGYYSEYQISNENQDIENSYIR